MVLKIQICCIMAPYGLGNQCWCCAGFGRASCGKWGQKALL